MMMMVMVMGCRRLNFMFLILCFFFGAVHIAPSLVVAGDSITPRQSLVDDNGTSQLFSAGHTFILGFFGSVGKRYVGIWYYKVSVQTVVWVANRQRPITVYPGTLSIASNGTLLLTDGNKSVVWSAYGSSASLANPVAQLLDDGNLVVREASSGGASNPGSFAWQSFDYPSDTLLPGMKLGWNLTSRLNRSLTAWTGPSDPTPSQYTLSMDLHGYPEIFLWAGNTKLWRTGPWNGIHFSGIPDMTYYAFSFDFVVNRDEVFYAFHVLDSYIARVIVSQTGITRWLVWTEDSITWDAYGKAPEDPCDSVSRCGPNGVCNPNDAPICDCVRGFRPKNPTSWDLRDGSDGCVRKTALDCRNGSDRLFTVTGAKLPDTSSSVVDMSLSLDQCKTMCLTNCSCKACAAANISDGSSGTGCIMWIDDLTDLRVYTNGGQELYVRLAAADLGPESNNSHNASTAVIIIVVIAAALLLSGAAFCVWKRKKRGWRAANLSFSERYLNEENEAKDLDLPMYDLVTIMAATGNFSPDNKIGQGGFGPVYKGNLGEGQEIAVKRLSKTSVQGFDEFKNEVVLIAKLQHRNLVRLLGCCIQGEELVRLLGCCIQGEERMLIYEYMPRGSLDAILFDKSKEKILDWQTRYNIILGIARGLVYLHQDSRFRIIHRDLKASNILLDKDMNPKISDFGMARIFGDETQVNTRRVVGTYGYMSPEYAMDGVFSVKSDVFSFGVSVLEIVSGKKNRVIDNSECQLNLLAHAWSLFREGKGLELVSETIGSSYRMDEAMRCIKVGLLCVQERPEDRPTMPSVVLMLSNEGVMLPQPRQPGFVAMRGLFETDSSLSRPDAVSINDITLTMFEGR